jgi:hypothetical protein
LLFLIQQREVSKVCKVLMAAQVVTEEKCKEKHLESFRISKIRVCPKKPRLA